MKHPCCATAHSVHRTIPSATPSWWAAATGRIRARPCRKSLQGTFSLAHHGVLFLDELPEFGSLGLEVMRQPIEDKVVTISRAQGLLTFPVNFQLVAAMNPRPEGYTQSDIFFVHNQGENGDLEGEFWMKSHRDSMGIEIPDTLSEQSSPNRDGAGTN